MRTIFTFIDKGTNMTTSKNASFEKPVYALKMDGALLPKLYFTRQEARDARSMIAARKSNTGVSVSVARLVAD